MILDLRSNGGGDAEAMTDIASTFLGAGLSLGQFTDRDGASFTISTHSRSLFTPEDRANKTSAGGIDERTNVERGRDFCRGAQAVAAGYNHRTETCGCVLAVRTRHLLPDGGLLDVSEMDYETARGDRLEGNGIKPDEKSR